MDVDLISAEETAARLGVKVETVYAYVSRGRLTRVAAGDGRSSQFDAVTVDKLASRRRTSVERVETGSTLSIDTAITQLGPDRLLYRGRDAAVCARTMTFESVAEWLWTGTDPGETVTWASDAATVGLAVKVGRFLPRGALLPDHLRALTAVVAASDPLRFDTRPEAFMGAIRVLLSTLVDALPVRRPGPTPKLRLGDHLVSHTFAARLWGRLSPLRADGPALAALNAALVLLADHELATSTFGVRVAASTRADPYACVLTGLGVLAGPLHGSASAAVQLLFVEASQPEGSTAAVARLLRQGERVPGFGHPLYPGGDPRATALLGLLRESGPNARRMAIVDGVLDAINRRHPMEPNIDFALAALAFTSMMPNDSGETIFALARSAGWVAHALEEFQAPPLRYRLRPASPKGS